jgi:hypothetical protein
MRICILFFLVLSCRLSFVRVCRVFSRGGVFISTTPISRESQRTNVFVQIQGVMFVCQLPLWPVT